MAEQGGERSLRAGQRFQAHHGQRCPDGGACGLGDTFVCGASYSVAGVHFHCANNKRHGVQNLAQALQNSCNQSFIQIAARLGKDAFCQYFEALGLCGATGIDLPAEPKKSEYYTADRMGPTGDFGENAGREGGARHGKTADHHLAGEL